MACGDRYASLLVTVSGLNLGNPSDDLATFDDYVEWRDLAERWGRLAQTFSDKLGEVEGVITPGSFPRWNSIQDLKSRMIDKLNDLPVFFASDPNSAIGDAQAAAFDAICVVELAEDNIVALGGSAPPIPNAPPPRENPDILPDIGGKVGIGLGVGIAVAVGVGVLLLARG